MARPDFYERLRSPPPYPLGTRVRVLAMPGDPDPVEPGTLGTIVGGNAAQMDVKWDNGRTLMLLPDIDAYEVMGGTDGARDGG